MKQYRLDVKKRLNAPYKSNDLRQRSLNMNIKEMMSDEDRHQFLQKEYEELIQEYDKGKPHGSYFQAVTT